MRQVAEFDAVENILSGREILQQHLRGEVALGQRSDRRQNPCIVEGLRGGHFDQHLRGPVGARPHHTAIGADVAGLHAMGDDRPVSSAAEIGHRQGAKGAGARCRNGGKKMSAGNPAENFGHHAR
jgi:hypothetical protein